MTELTIAYVTSRRDPKIEWFFDSLAKQRQPDFGIRIIVIDHWRESPGRGLDVAEKFLKAFPFERDTISDYVTMLHVAGKPSVWKGASRLTKEDWWSKSSDLNSAIALCQTPWICFCDDRSILWRAWLDRVKEAMKDEVAVCGSYEKWANMEVTDGVRTGGTLLGEDTRTPGIRPFDSLYGGSAALPLEWCLAVNGYPEICDSLGLEDSLFGTLLQNQGFPLRYDSDMRLIEDRTPGQIDGALKRADKGTSPADKSHRLVELLRDSIVSLNPYSLRELRESVLAGNPFPPPSPGQDRDWFDGQLISEMT